MGHCFQSELRRWDVVSGLCQSIDARTYVEIGCKAGETTGRVLAECPNLSAIAIDPWRQQEASTDVTRETYADWNFEKIQQEFWKNIAASHDRCSMYRQTSEQAHADIIGNSHFDCDALGDLVTADVVFIDALHDYESVKQDIALWWPLVREGGYLVLHDYNHKWPGVMRAVAEAFNLMDVCCGPDSTAWVQKPIAAKAAA